MRALKQLGIISAIASLSWLMGAPSAQADTLISTAGALSEGDSRLEDGSLFDRYTFSGTSGQQITIILESREFDPYLILIDPSGARIKENDDISRSNLNARLVLELPNSGIYTVYANSYDATKGGRYDITVRTNDRSAFPTSLATLLLNPSEQCNAALSSAVKRVETDRDIAVLLSVIQLINRYETVPADRPDGVEMSLYGSATASVMASSQFLTQIASDLIGNCTSVGAVVFSPDASEERIFGYLPPPASRSVGEFNCAITVAAAPEQLAPWGQKLCL